MAKISTIRRKKKKKEARKVYEKRNEHNRQIKKYIRQLTRLTDEMRSSEIGWFKLEFEFFKQESNIKEVAIFIK